MDNAESAGNAAAGMHGKMMDGRALVVRLRSEGPGGKPDRPRGFGPAENDESKVGSSTCSLQLSDNSSATQGSLSGVHTAAACCPCMASTWHLDNIHAALAPFFYFL